MQVASIVMSQVAVIGIHCKLVARITCSANSATKAVTTHVRMYSQRVLPNSFRYRLRMLNFSNVKTTAYRFPSTTTNYSQVT